MLFLELLEKTELIGAIQRNTEIHSNSLRMSYVIFKSPESLWPELKKPEVYRVVSPPVETYHGKRYYLCGYNGKKVLNIRQAIPEKAKAISFLRRGDVISIKHALEKDNGFYLLDETEIKVESSCSKAIPEILKEEF